MKKLIIIAVVIGLAVFAFSKLASRDEDFA